MLKTKVALFRSRKETNTKTNALNMVNEDEQEDEIHPADATPS
jgi:hypothetical protein